LRNFENRDPRSNFEYFIEMDFKVTELGEGVSWHVSRLEIGMFV